MFIPLCFLVEEQKRCTSGLCYIARFILWFCLWPLREGKANLEDDFSLLGLFFICSVRVEGLVVAALSCETWRSSLLDWGRAISFLIWSWQKKIKLETAFIRPEWCIPFHLVNIQHIWGYKRKVTGKRPERNLWVCVSLICESCKKMWTMLFEFQGSWMVCWSGCTADSWYIVLSNYFEFFSQVVGWNVHLRCK